MALWADLLDQSQFLATVERDVPRQASLRRSVSATYYALFHFLTGEAASSLIPAQPTGLRLAFQRVFDHRRMKNACEDLVKPQVPVSLRSLVSLPLEPELRTMARTFIDLQAARQSADYDLHYTLTRMETLNFLLSAREAIEGWQRISGTTNGNVFLAHLAGLVGTR